MQGVKRGDSTVSFVLGINFNWTLHELYWKGSEGRWGSGSAIQGWAIGTVKLSS
jgi:hypothetical protein